MSSDDLPTADSSDVYLEVASSEEFRETWRYNSAEWQGPLPLDIYYQREEYLLTQDLVKDGGLTPWILVHDPRSGGSRKILCACETIKKRALAAKDGTVKESFCHGVASVFCPAKHRGRGYAAKMISELAKKVEKWQAEDGQALFSILYSDIGKKFYAAHGWRPFTSSHVSLPSAQCGLRSSTRYLTEEELPALCSADEASLHDHLKAHSRDVATVAVVPDMKTIRWHQARADFFAYELLGKQISKRGAIIESPDGRLAWCYWQHNWSKAEPSKDNKLYILRIASSDGSDVDADLIESLLAAAQAEAHAWDLRSVEVWSPSPETKVAARRLDAEAEEVLRETSSITSLLWFGEGDSHDIRWICNERYAWC